MTISEVVDIKIRYQNLSQNQQEETVIMNTLESKLEDLCSKKEKLLAAVVNVEQENAQSKEILQH